MPAISPLLWRLSIIGTRALGLLPVRYLRAAYIIKSGPYARIKAKAAVCTLQVRPPNRSQGSLLSSPLNQPAEHKYRTDKPARAAVIGIFTPCAFKAFMRSVPISHTETVPLGGAEASVLRAFQPCTARTKRDESPVMHTENGARR